MMRTTKQEERKMHMLLKRDQAFSVQQYNDQSPLEKDHSRTPLNSRKSSPAFVSSLSTAAKNVFWHEGLEV